MRKKNLTVHDLDTRKDIAFNTHTILTVFSSQMSQTQTLYHVKSKPGNKLLHDLYLSKIVNASHNYSGAQTDMEYYIHTKKDL